LFFLNALLDRLVRYYAGVKIFTPLFYALVGIALLYQIGLIAWTGRVRRLQVAAAAWIAFVVILGAVYGDAGASIVAVKQFFFGVVFLFLFSAQPLPVGVVITDLVGVLAYALFQGSYFLTQGLRLPPWDAAYVKERLEAGVLNAYQGDLIRPFATFGSFTEYQIVVHVFVMCLFLLRARLSTWQGRTVVGLFVMLALQDVLLTDRTPILMSLIILSVCFLGSAVTNGLLTGSRRLFDGLFGAASAGFVFILISQGLVNSDNPGVRRLGESAQFWNAETVQQRETHEWSSARQSIAWFPEGMGPNEVAIDYNPKAQRPHNGFFLLQIGYSYLTPVLFVGFIVFAFSAVYATMPSPRPELARIGFCGLGITCAYVAASFFNVPFNGYGGPAFFLTMYWLRRESVHLR